MTEVGKCLYCERSSMLRFHHRKEQKYIIQLNPGISNYQGKLKLLRVIGVSSSRGFEQNDQKHLIKVVLCLDVFYCKISSKVRA